MLRRDATNTLMAYLQEEKKQRRIYDAELANYNSMFSSTPSDDLALSSSKLDIHRDMIILSLIHI